MAKKVSTFDRLMKDPKRKSRFDKGYKAFLLSELLCEIMEENKISVRQLASKAGISPTVIQDIRSGKKTNATLNSISNIFGSMGYQLIAKKKKKEFVLSV
jgi:transcriptional regulator with XRE-family HTH domain